MKVTRGMSALRETQKLESHQLHEPDKRTSDYKEGQEKKDKLYGYYILSS